MFCSASDHTALGLGLSLHAAGNGLTHALELGLALPPALLEPAAVPPKHQLSPAPTLMFWMYATLPLASVTRNSSVLPAG